MKKDKEKLVQEVAGLQSEMSSLTLDKVNEIAPKAEEVEVKVSMKDKAKAEGAKYIEPKKTLPPVGTLKPEWKKKRDYDWQYVKGMFQPDTSSGRATNEPKSFWFSKWAGDPDCWWEIPVNTPVYVPRMIAYYLSGEKDEDTGMESMKYHSFDYVQRPEPYWRTDDFTHQFSPTATHYRGRFVPMGVFS